MALKRRFFNPVTLGVGLVLLVAVVVAIASLSSPRMVSTTMTDSYGYAMGGETANEVAYLAATAPAPMQAQQPVNAPAGISDGTIDVDDQNVQEPQTRVILKSASLRLVVSAADSALESISAMAENMGGWVVTSSTSMVRTAAGESVAQGSITIRVPSDKLDEALTQIKSGAGKIEYENVSGQDVTQQYVDLSSRLTNLEAAETQLRTIMDDARKTEDVLSVYNQLVSTRGEIEQIRGQLQYFNEASAYSSISVDLIPEAINTPIQIVGWSPGRTVENALATLVNILQSGADVLITAAVLVVPLGLVALIPVWFIRRAWRRRAQRSISAA
jgi:hypothetical protein